jgi:hypothetical protein
LPSSISCAVPVGTGTDGEIAAETVTVVPCTAVDGVTVTVVVLGSPEAPTVKETGAETEDW